MIVEISVIGAHAGDSRFSIHRNTTAADFSD